MSLFFVNRYLGDEEDGFDNKESRSQAFLAKLKQKAKERQKQSGLESTPQTEQQQEDNTELLKSKKKRKKVIGQSERKSEEGSDQGENVVKKKKKKKDEDMKQKDQSDFQTCVTEDGQKHASSESPEKPAPVRFMVLGGFLKKPVQKVHRVLPQWLAQPHIIQREIKSNRQPISAVPGLCAHLIKKLQNNHIQHFFPVQAEVIPAVLESAQHGLLIGPGGYKPRDICVSAPTGSGKTLAFVLPVVQVLMQRVVCAVRALAVLPTKELAQQVCKVFTSYAEGTTLKVVMLAGQKSFAVEQASLTEVRGGERCSLADIVVATPGRLVDHINKNSGLCLKQLRFLIIDEADRMIDSMHQSWLSQVVKAVYTSESEVGAIFRRAEPTHITAASLCPPQIPLQKLLFSATLTQNPEKLQQLGLHQPCLFTSVHRSSEVDTGEISTAPAPKQDRFDFPQGLSEYYVPCTLSKKPLVLLHFVIRMRLSPILCFTNSREAAHRLFVLIQLFGGVQVAEFSSRLTPGERKKTLKEFEQGKIHLLVSTDAAARGIDINGVKCVVNYDAPQYIRTYIHRIGRTARAGKAGLAFTFLLGVQEKDFLQMVSDAGSPGIQKQTIKPELLKNMEARYEETLSELAKVINKEKARSGL